VSPIETFEPEASSAAYVRRFVARTLSAWDVDGDDVSVVANELATNAILHGRTLFSVRLDLDGDRCRVEIVDRNPRMPVLGATCSDATSGHGLGLVDALSARWGAEARADGKAVWCELPLGAAQSGSGPTTDRTPRPTETQGVH